MGDASMSVEQEVAIKQQEKQPAIGFDQKIKALFANKSIKLQNAIDFHLTQNRERYGFSNDWWRDMYAFGRDEPNQSQSDQTMYDAITKIMVESLDSLPPNAALPSFLGQLLSTYFTSDESNAPMREKILDNLRNPSIPLFLRVQLGEQLAKSAVTPYSVDTIMQAYGILRENGEDVGKEVRGQIFPLMLAGLAYDQYEPYREDLVKLFEETAVKEANPKKPSLISRARAHFKLKTHKEPQSLEVESMDKKRLAERRVEVIRNLVLELFPSVPKNQDPYWSYAYSSRKGETPGQSISSDMLTLPIETLEQYLVDLRSLKEWPEFTNLSSLFFSREGIVSPYVSLGKASRLYEEVKNQIPIASILRHLNELGKSGRLDDRIVDEVLIGINKDLFSNDQIRSVARRNLKNLITHQLSQHISNKIDNNSYRTIVLYYLQTIDPSDNPEVAIGTIVSLITQIDDTSSAELHKIKEQLIPLLLASP